MPNTLLSKVNLEENRGGAAKPGVDIPPIVRRFYSKSKEMELYLPTGSQMGMIFGRTSGRRWGSWRMTTVYCRKYPPLGPDASYQVEEMGPDAIEAYPGADGNFVYYEDEGNNYNTKRRHGNSDDLEWCKRTLTIDARRGAMKGCWMSGSLQFWMRMKDSAL